MRRKIAIWSAAYALILAVGAWSIPASVDAASYTKCKADETLVEWAHDDDRRRAGDVGGYDCLDSGGNKVFEEHYLSRVTPAHPAAQSSAPTIVDDAPGHRVLVYGSGSCGGWERADGTEEGGSGFYIFVYRPC